MEEPRPGRFWRRTHGELRRTRIGRALLRRLRAARRASQLSEPRTREARPGPYETSYDVTHGYATERSIVLP